MIKFYFLYSVPPFYTPCPVDLKREHWPETGSFSELAQSY